ncbi:uncharacterized protein LOC111477668 [Cucurbita maxima]|uniref:Uncharacterized protein LOC111477668 n=1 Tax=Cucurbita maxima TaxID=3661 RepID=A0A6J1IR14_CUCMA|nr:uncharacterized protein LOC111477668 [Cucurbita maxima]
MGLIFMAMLCCVSLLILSVPFASSHALDQSSPLQETEAVHSPRLVLSRKFKMLEEAKVVEAHGFQASKQEDEQKENVSGQPYKREENKGKGRKWGNVADMSSRFLTMDYAHIKRRRPVHNMSRQRP